MFKCLNCGQPFNASEDQRYCALCQKKYKPTREIYRGYDIDYGPDHAGVWILKDGVKLDSVNSVAAGYTYIDRLRRKEINKMP